MTAFRHDSGPNIVYRLPRLQALHMPQPYVRSVGGVAQVDRSRLVDTDQRKSANGPRKVEDPVLVKAKLKQVGHKPFLPDHHRANEDNLPVFPTQPIRPVMGTSCDYEDISLHSYSDAHPFPGAFREIGGYLLPLVQPTDIWNRQSKPAPVQIGSICLVLTSLRSSSEIFSFCKCVLCWTQKDIIRKIRPGRSLWFHSTRRWEPSSKDPPNSLAGGYLTRSGRRRLCKRC